MMKIAADDCSSILVYYVFIREKKKKNGNLYTHRYCVGNEFNNEALITSGLFNFSI